MPPAPKPPFPRCWRKQYYVSARGATTFEDLTTNHLEEQLTKHPSDICHPFAGSSPCFQSWSYPRTPGKRIQQSMAEGEKANFLSKKYTNYIFPCLTWFLLFFKKKKKERNYWLQIPQTSGYFWPCITPMTLSLSLYLLGNKDKPRENKISHVRSWLQGKLLGLNLKAKTQGRIEVALAEGKRMELI